jgi:hypothetical protein
MASTSTSPRKAIGKTDVIYQQFKLYIEGVQVPFISIVITQGIGTLPQANIQVPPQAGLMDIARFYKPKVHIFYTDRIEDQSRKDLDKVLFIGVIESVSYYKSTEGNGSIGITFQCSHKNSVLSRTLVDYSGWLNDSTEQQGTSAAVKGDRANSGEAILEALNGIGGGLNKAAEISKSTPSGDPSVLPSKWADKINRFVGMPGAAVNYWNQLKRSAYMAGEAEVSDGWQKIYEPLVEDGIQFFDRMGGHYLIEKDIEDTRMSPCNSSKEVLVPPTNRLFLASAVQAQMGVDMLRNYLQISGEITDFLQVLQTMYEHIEYDFLTLASPAEAPLPAPGVDQQDSSMTPAEAMEKYENQKNVSTSALETIIKPKTPFYFSPSCNVFLPGMYTSVSVSYDEGTIPTRIDLKNTEMPGNARGTHFRAPDSIRKAIAKKAASPINLLASEGPSFGAVGRFEQGRGVEVEYLMMPPWLAYLSQSQFAEGLSSEVYPDETKDPENFAALKRLEEGWAKRYPKEEDKAMNPWSKDSGISAHHRMLFAAVDYYYTKLVTRSKVGTLECPFNPYVVPGYPMDIIEKNPNLPSFHATCTSITHSISAGGVATSVQFTAATTYSEMANYYIPFIHPYLQVVLGLSENPTLVNNTAEAKDIADSFYYSTLGVKSVAPEDLYDFQSSGAPIPLKKNSMGKLVRGSMASITASNGGELNPYLSYEGNLTLTYRPVESKKSIEDRFKITFIDLDQKNYSTTAVSYTPKELSTADKFELGQSQFLDYSTYFGEPL